MLRQARGVVGDTTPSRKKLLRAWAGGSEAAYWGSQPVKPGVKDGASGHYFVRVAEGADGDLEDYPFYNAAVFCVPTLVEP